MGKRGRGAKKDNRSSKRRGRDVDVNPEDMDDEIDVCKFFLSVFFCACYDVNENLLLSLLINRFFMIF